MTKNQAFQVLKKKYIHYEKAYLKALSKLTLDSYLEVNNFQQISDLHTGAVNSSIDLISFILNERADRADKYVNTLLSANHTT